MRINRIALIMTAIAIGFADFSFSQDVRFQSTLQGEGICEECLKTQLKIPGVDNVNEQFRDLTVKVNIFGRDNREVQSRLGPRNPYAPIGRIKTYRTHIENGELVANAGSAIMVSPCYAVTNYHVVFGERATEEVIPYVKTLMQQFPEFARTRDKTKLTVPADHNYIMKFSVGQNTQDGSFKYKDVMGIPVAFMDNQAGTTGHDFVLIRFEEPNCPGGDPEVGWANFASLSNEKLLNVPLEVAGYPGDRPPKLVNGKEVYELYKGGECKIREVLDGYEGLKHDCANRGGQSGGSLAAVIDGKLLLVGLNVGAVNPVEDKILPKYDPKNPALEKYLSDGVDIRLIAQKIGKQIQKDIDAFLQRQARGDQSGPHGTENI